MTVIEPRALPATIPARNRTHSNALAISLHCILYTVVQKNAPNLADYNCNPVQSIFIIFSKLFVNDHKSCLTNRSFRYAAPHLWNKLPPSLRVPCQSATTECSPPLPGSDSTPKSVVGMSHRVFHSRLKTHLLPFDPFPRNRPLSNGLISRFLCYTCTEVSGVENIGQCGRLSQLSWLLGALK